MSAELTRLVSQLSRAEIEKLLAVKDEVEQLEARRRELETEIERLVADRARYEYELRDYEATVAADGY